MTKRFLIALIAVCMVALSGLADDNQAVYGYLYEKDNTLHTAKGDKSSLALSVRCVR